MSVLQDGKRNAQAQSAFERFTRAERVQWKNNIVFYMHSYSFNGQIQHVFSCNGCHFTLDNQGYKIAGMVSLRKEHEISDNVWALIKRK